MVELGANLDDSGQVLADEGTTLVENMGKNWLDLAGRHMDMGASTLLGALSKRVGKMAHDPFWRHPNLRLVVGLPATQRFPKATCVFLLPFLVCPPPGMVSKQTLEFRSSTKHVVALLEG